ncbi:MAG: hypothetical protein K2J77_04285, partial [Oscillospiraceae bacterium]|nr:hypothetical protein [Oscillospiraceae bacterium]
MRKIWGVARTEFVGWITNPRVIILGILLIFIKTLAIDPLAARAEKFGDTMIIFEPYIAVGNSGALTLFMPLVFLVLLSDYPRLDGSSLFSVSRTGKKNWLCGQILFLIMAIITFLAAIFVASMLFSGGHFGTEWSEAIRKYNARFPDEAASFDSQLLPSNLYNQIPMMTAVWQTSALLAAYLLSLALIIYLLKILFGNAAGLAGAILVMALGTVTTALYSPIKWAFPTANTIIWLHYTEILSEPVYPMWASFFYFGMFLSLLIVGNFFALKKLKFT